MKPLVDMGSGSLGDSPVLKGVLDKAQSRMQVGSLLRYPSPSGVAAFREGIQRVFELREDREILLTHSATDALDLILRCHAARGSDFFVQSPAFFGVLRQLKAYGKVKYWSRPQELEEQLPQGNALVYVSSNHHPTDGRNMSEDDKAHLSSLLAASHAVLLEDNPSDPLFLGDRFPGRISDNYPSSLLVGSLSKVLGPGFRLGFIAASSESIRGLRSELITRTLSVPAYLQELAQYAFDEDYLPDFRSFLRRRWESFRALLDSHGFTYDVPDGGVFVKVHLPRSTPLEALVALLREQGYAFEENRYSHADGINRPFLRLNFVQHDDEVNDMALKALSVSLCSLYERKA